MNFFQRQDLARRKTRVLVFYFAAALILLAVAVNAALFFIASITSQYKGSSKQWMGEPYWIYITVVTLAVIAAGSLLRLFQLRRGGRAVAAMVGARRVNPAATDPDERRLINVTEEMSVASGMPVPEIYIMENEGAINAFVAGFKPTESVLVVTRGALQSLSRDQLQGVIAHEFSHVFFGDMRLNVRLIGILAGILAIGQMGLFLMRSLRHTRRASGKRSGQGILLVLSLGLALFIIGYIGLFFGRLIKAAISRQREYLADATSVQYTRNPPGIAGALWKIKRHLSGSALVSRHAEDMSHMCFGASQNFYLKSLFATHPPLDQRIRAIDPGFQPTQEVTEKKPLRKKVDKEDVVIPIPDMAAGLSGGEVPASPESITGSVGNPTPRHMGYAAELLSGIPDKILEATHALPDSKAVIYSLLLCREPQGLETGLELVQKREGALVKDKAKEYHRSILPLGPRMRLPLVDLAIPCLKQLSRTESEPFLGTMDALIELDCKMTLFEFMLRILLRKHLNPRTGRAGKVKYKSIAPVLAETRLLLSALAYTGAGATEKAEAPYLKAMNRLTRKSMPLIPRSEITGQRLDLALDKLENLSPFLKSPLLDACALCVLDDNRIRISEAELLRAISAKLDCPMPPLLA